MMSLKRINTLISGISCVRSTRMRRSLLQMMITEGYDTFVSRCAEGRHMTKEAIEKIAEGRVWTGETAKELGLVDELGGIDKALDIAVAKAGIEGYTVVVLS